MSDANIQQVLGQMRALAAQAQRPAGTEAVAQPSAGQAQGRDFQGMLADALGQVNDLQQASGQKSDAFLRGGDVSLAEAMIAGQKSRVAFTAVKETRSHLLEAYRQISRMQV